MTEIIRLVLADDHPIYRDGLVLSLADAGGIAIVGVAKDGEDAAALVARERPDVVLLDISMPKGGGIGEI